MHRAKGDRLVRASVLPVCDNGIRSIGELEAGIQGSVVTNERAHVILVYYRIGDLGRLKYFLIHC